MERQQITQRTFDIKLSAFTVLRVTKKEKQLKDI